MLSSLAATFAGSSGISALSTLLVKFIRLRMEMRQQEEAIKLGRHTMYMEMMASVTKRENSHPMLLISGIFSRAYMLVVSTGMLIFATVWGAIYPDAVIFYPDVQEPWRFSLLGLINIEGSERVTWRELHGLVILPIWSIIIGAQIGFFLGSAMFNKQ